MLGLADGSFQVRYQCGLALLQLRERNGALRFTGQRLIEAALAEPDLANPRGLGHVFNLLSLAFEGEPLDVAHLALRGDDPGLRGTALEYLDHVLPEPVKARLRPHLGRVGASSAATRRPEEVRASLLRSAESLVRPRRR
jgi:hypothetical protein